MSGFDDFVQYRGNGTTRDGRPAEVEGEAGRYLADADLIHAVNAALAIEQPLLVTGEAGTGKTALAFSIAAELELGEVEVFPVRSDHRGSELLYDFDNLRRFYDAQVATGSAADPSNYLRLGVLGRSFQADSRKVVLIDEIDKAPRDFPNDLLHALDRMEIRIPEIEMVLRARHRPIVVITSNQESQLPDPFLRRCVFHYLAPPDRNHLRRILDERLGHLHLAERLRERVIDRFLALRQVEGLLKKPATGELIAWTRVLYRAGVPAEQLDALALKDLPHLGTLLKTRQDLERVRADIA